MPVQWDSVDLPAALKQRVFIGQPLFQGGWRWAFAADLWAPQPVGSLAPLNARGGGQQGLTAFAQPNRGQPGVKNGTLVAAHDSFDF